MTEEEILQQHKIRLLENNPHLTEQDAEVWAMAVESLSKPENRKEMFEISPELEAQLKKLVGR